MRCTGPGAAGSVFWNGAVGGGCSRPVSFGVSCKPMPAQRQLPDFATAAWYSDHNDHRCPHDAWLESIEFTEPAVGERQEQRKTAFTLKLLCAYHDGHIIFRYAGVTGYQLSSESCGRGLCDWLHDEFSVAQSGLISHHITWCMGPSQQSHWLIEAEDVRYEWVPESS